jgi:hypothetical protein
MTLKKRSVRRNVPATAIIFHDRHEHELIVPSKATNSAKEG